MRVREAEGVNTQEVHVRVSRVRSSMEGPPQLGRVGKEEEVGLLEGLAGPPRDQVQACSPVAVKGCCCAEVVEAPHPSEACANTRN